ncbi:MAG TPA: hypothetical protein VF771_04395, partial [Longimicrobiaceae bacterium]
MTQRLRARSVMAAAGDVLVRGANAAVRGVRAVWERLHGRVLSSELGGKSATDDDRTWTPAESIPAGSTGAGAGYGGASGAASAPAEGPGYAGMTGTVAAAESTSGSADVI